MISITVSGIKELQKKFTAFNSSFRYRRKELMRRIKEELLADIEQNFATESNNGDPWQDLAESTWKNTPNRVGGILTRTGRMRNGFYTLEGKDHISIVNTTVDNRGKRYAAYHEFGIGTNPLRKILPKYERARMLATQIAKEYIDERLQEAGLR